MVRVNRGGLSVQVLVVAVGMALPMFFGCSSSPEVKKQAYAKLKDERTFEHEFPATWKAIETAFREYKIKERDPEEVSFTEMKKLKKREIETDWVYGQSRDKYIEYRINDSPRKQYLQTRFKCHLIAERTLGGTRVNVKVDEEIERLDQEGASLGYESFDEVDTSRPNEILDKISLALLSAAP